MALALRPESPADIPAIHALVRAAFFDAPHAAHTEQFIVDALRNAGVLFIENWLRLETPLFRAVFDRQPWRAAANFLVSLVAEDDGVVAGHVALSPVSMSDGASAWHGLGPLSVAPERQRQGIGSMLVTEALRRLKEKGAAGCVLVGDPAYYARFGFRQEKSLVLPGIPSEFFQAISFSRILPRAIVAFHAAFGA